MALATLWRCFLQSLGHRRRRLFLWPQSPSTLRKKFAALQSALGLGLSGVKFPFALASIRPGGGTHWLQATEDVECVRRKGRWISGKVLEVYMQESTFATYKQTFSESSKSRIQGLCQNVNLFLKEQFSSGLLFTFEAAWH